MIEIDYTAKEKTTPAELKLRIECLNAMIERKSKNKKHAHKRVLMYFAVDILFILLPLLTMLWGGHSKTVDMLATFGHAVAFCAMVWWSFVAVKESSQSTGARNALKILFEKAPIIIKE